jgi:hypothetical protein
MLSISRSFPFRHNYPTSIGRVGGSYHLYEEVSTAVAVAAAVVVVFVASCTG